MSLGLKVAATGQPFISIGIDQHALLPQQTGVGQKRTIQNVDWNQAGVVNDDSLLGTR